jgi:hypothetical protein
MASYSSGRGCTLDVPDPATPEEDVSEYAFIAIELAECRPRE